MSSDGEGGLRYGVDRLVARGTRIFGWGWVADASRTIDAVALAASGDAGERRLPANFGLARDDVRDAFPHLVNGRTSGFVVTGYLPPPPLRRLALELAFADGGTAEIDVAATLETHSAGRRKLREVGWLARAVLRRVRLGDFRGILRRARSQNYGAPSLDAEDIVAKLLPRLRRGPPLTLAFDHAMGGGANVYRRAMIAERLAAGRSVLLCTYNLPTLDCRLSIFAPGAPEEVFRLPSFLALDRVVDEAPVDELFLNSPVSFDEPLVLAEWLATMRAAHPRARLVVTAHDYIAVCPSFVLLDADGRYCGIPDVAACARCLARHRASYVMLSPPTEIGPWRALWGRCLAAADEVRCFSESTRGLLLRAHPTLDVSRITVVPHRVDFAPARRPAPDFGKPLAIGVVGHISVQKGALIVRDLVHAIDRERRDARVVVIGTLDAAPDSPRLTVTGSYARDDLVRLIEAHGVNVCLFPSICPETFSYVIEELTMLGLPIVAFDLGAPAERLRKYGKARICAEVSADAALSAAAGLHAELAAERAPVA